MTRKNLLVQSPPYPVEKTIRILGDSLRVARLRRNMTISEVAQRIGTGPRAVMDAEKGKPSSGIAVFAALLWLYDLLDQLGDVCEPSTDRVGLALESIRERKRARKRKDLNNDF